MDALGSVTREKLGNNLFTQRYVNPATGLVELITTGGSGNAVIQNLAMEWDRVGNLKTRIDENAVGNGSPENPEGRQEGFMYDGLGRLQTVTLKTAAGSVLGTETMQYSPVGNLLTKGSFTNYQYTHAGRPHQVSAVTTPGGTRGYSYDANGNLTQVTGPGARAVTWWSFNKPRRMERDGNNHAEYWYGPGGDRAMFRQSARINGQTVLTLYGSALYERRHAGATTEHTHHVQANGRTVATVHRSGTSPANTTRFLHKDHLGSVVAITSETGAIVEALAYDAWGKRRPASTWQTPAPGVFIAAITLTRGFTMHEHLDQVGLIHMGGRVYDPELGRFLSPDPFVQFPISTQGFNRYAYVGNNPLSHTDPSGYFLKDLVKTVATVAISYYTAGWATGVLKSAMAGSAVGGAVGGYLSTGTGQGAMLGALAGGLAYGIGHKVPGFEGASYAEPGKLVAKSLTHGVTQGLIAKAGGGRFGDGALGAFAASIGGPSVARAGPGIREAMAAAALGGTVSVIGGGKFANGAIAAAWVNLFNDQMNSRYRTKQDAEAEANALNDSGAGEIRWTTKYTGSEYGHTVMPADIAALELVSPDLAKSVFSASSTGACSMFCGAAVPVASAIFGDITNGPASDQLNASISFGNNMDRTMRVLREHPSAGVRAFTRGLERAPGSVRWALILTAAVNNYQQCYSACTAHYLNRK